MVAKCWTVSQKKKTAFCGWVKNTKVNQKPVILSPALCCKMKPVFQQSDLVNSSQPLNCICSFTVRCFSQAVIERRPNIFECLKYNYYACFLKGFSLITYAVLYTYNIVSSSLSTSGRPVTPGCTILQKNNPLI